MGCRPKGRERLRQTFTREHISIEVPCDEDEKRLALALFEVMGLIVPVTLNHPEPEQMMNCYRLAETNDGWSCAPGVTSTDEARTVRLLRIHQGAAFDTASSSMHRENRMSLAEMTFLGICANIGNIYDAHRKDTTRPFLCCDTYYCSSIHRRVLSSIPAGRLSSSAEPQLQYRGDIFIDVCRIDRPCP